MMRASSELVESACAGNEAAITQLLTECQPDLKRFARRTCSNTEDAEDAVQVALWQLHRKIGTLRTVAAFATWLFRIIERECYRLFRGRDKAVSLAESQWVSWESAQASLIPLDLRADLTQAIRALPEAYRSVLIMRDVDGLSAPEVAAELGLGIDAVKTRLHRARGMVREKLVASGYWDANGNTEKAGG